MSLVRLIHTGEKSPYTTQGHYGKVPPEALSNHKKNPNETRDVFRQKFNRSIRWIRMNFEKKMFRRALEEKFKIEYISLFYDPEFSTIINSLYAVGVKKDSEVILPVIANIKIFNAIREIGAEPKIVDVTDANAMPDLPTIRRLYSEKTSAIILTPLWGYPATTSELVEFSESNSIPLITDVTKAIGVKNGIDYEGTLGTLSYFFTDTPSLIKTNSTYAVVLTNNSEIHREFDKLYKTSKKSYSELNDDSVIKNFSMATENLNNLDLHIDELHSHYLRWKKILVNTYDIMKPVWYQGSVKYNYQTVLFCLSEEAADKISADELIDLIARENIIPDYKNNRINLLSDNIDDRNFENGNFLRKYIFPLQVDSTKDKTVMKKVADFICNTYNKPIPS